MTITLTNPRPTDLGIVSPALGPWFSSDKRLSAPDAALGVAVNFTSGEAWLPPTAGLLSLYLAESDRPYSIAGLRHPDGTPAFAEGRLVAVFRLLPEVEERLHSLMRFLPPVTAAPPTGDPTAAVAPTRARVRTFALELSPTLDPTNPATFIDGLGNLLVPGFPSFVSRGLTDARDIRRAKAAYLGLSIPATGTEIVRSGARPMNDLKRPGRFELPSGSGITPEPEKLLRFPDGMSARLFVFDDRGLPLDPGAVATWWKFLATRAFDNLWAAGFSGTDQRTASLDGGARFTLHLVNPHGGHLANDQPLMGRSQLTNVTALPDTSAPRNLRSSTTGDVTITFNSADPAAAADNAPFPRVALLPVGRFATSLRVWQGDWSGFAINRDFVQVALVEAESHLVGIPRLLPAGTGNPVIQRRAADQNRITTRVNVVRATGDLVQSTIDAATQAILTTFDGTGATTLVAGAVDRDYGSLSALTALPAPLPPDALPEFTGTVPSGAQELKDSNGRRVGIVHPLIGGTERVLVELALGNALAGAWVRVWAQDFSTRTGSRSRLDGGAGRADANGRVFAAIALETGATGTASPSGLDILIKTAGGVREYPDLRFARPAPVSGSAIALTDTPTILLCETAQTLTTSSLSNAIPSGVTAIALASGSRTAPALIDRTSIPAAAFADHTLIRQLASGDTLVLTQPAFVLQPEGDLTPPLGGITIQRMVRRGIDRITDGSVLAAGAPLPGQERLEGIAARIEGSGSGNAAAAFSTTPALGRFHELLPHQQGHPGAPATAEFHGTGVTLSGASALLLAELVRDRRDRLSSNLMSNAFNTPLPNLTAVPDNDPATWVTLLRTAGKGSEGDIGMDILADAFATSSTTPGTIARDVERWIRQRRIDADTSTLPAEVQSLVSTLNSILAALPPATGSGQEQNVLSAARALDRRFQAARGIREGALSLLAAVQRAEDFIYIETPALDNLACGSGDEQINFWMTLRDRLNTRTHRALKLILCVPLQLNPFAPAPLQTVRDALLKAALEELRSLPHYDQRVVILTPNAATGRSLYLSSTTVIIDDAYLLTGTTHLWRRGLSFDASLAVSVLDETVEGGRSRTVRQLRRQLIADRLGLSVHFLPENPSDLMEALRLLPGRDGGRRLTLRTVAGSILSTDTTTNNVWNPDASPGSGFNLATFLVSLAAIREHIK